MLEPQRPRVQLPENCSTRSELWFQLLQLCSGTNNVQLEVSCSNSLHRLLNHLLHIRSMLGAVLGSLVPFPAVHAVPGEPKAVVKTASCAGTILGCSVELGEPGLELVDLARRDDELREDGNVAVLAALGESIELQSSRIQLNIFHSKTTIHVRLHFSKFGGRATHQNLHTLLPDLLDHPLQVVLHVPHVSHQARCSLVALPTQHLVAAGGEAVVDAVLGARLHLGVELGEVGPEVLTLGDVKDDSQGEMSVGHDEEMEEVTLLTSGQVDRPH